METEVNEALNEPPPARTSSPTDVRDSENIPRSTQSLVSVSLSDTDGIVDPDDSLSPQEEVSEPSTDSSMATPRSSSAEIRYSLQSDKTRSIVTRASNQNLTVVTEGLSEAAAKRRTTSRDSSPTRSRSSSSVSDSSVQVDWDQLEKTEESEPRDEGSDESTAFLLARLEQENNALATDPKSGIKPQARRFSRPPSMNQIKRLCKDRDTSGLRHSLLPSPPPMTELEFWAALVKDYPQTAQRLPTLTANKIRAGIPPPLRGVVWVSMAGAREQSLEDAFDRLCGETSPYDNIIGKDIGRSFPGVEMFRDPEGEGQRMLGRVLKCFSLYDDKIGYCQGLGFLVGPLLMQMGEREAFCILVRLMEDYGLRSCFLPDLSGLHLRIYQFQRLLRQHMPLIADHLDALQVEAAYLSQWFLSFFAVTCPLPMLFRIYDVILAEGASETIMRVALSVMQRNESRILASTEFEDVMQLLLSRALWDPYGCNTQSADELVNDFVAFTGVVTRESLQSLELSFKAAQTEGSDARPAVQREVQNAASRFLDRLWSRTNTQNIKPSSLSPPLSAPLPFSLLHRTNSKQSLASTLNSVEDSSGSSIGTIGSTFTEDTSLSRDDSTDSISLKLPDTSSGATQHSMSSKGKNLDGQIEDLLAALSEMQREHASLAAQLQKEREERSEDHRIASSLMRHLKSISLQSDEDLRRRTAPVPGSASEGTDTESESHAEELKKLLVDAELRFGAAQDRGQSADIVDTQQLRESLASAKEQLQVESTRSHELTQRLSEQERETNQAREQLREARSRIQDNLREKQRLEKTIHELRMARKPSFDAASCGSAESTGHLSLARSDTADSSTSSGHTGLRELKLGRGSTRAAQPPKIQTSQSPASSADSHQHSQSFSKRTSSLATQAVLSGTDHQAPVPNDALLLELVNAKTAEAVARQELDELKAKYDALRKSAGSALSPAMPSPATIAGSGGKGPSPVEPASVKTHASTPSSGGLGFWGWGKRSLSTSQATAAQGA